MEQVGPIEHFFVGEMQRHNYQGLCHGWVAGAGPAVVVAAIFMPSPAPKWLPRASALITHFWLCYCRHGYHGVLEVGASKTGFLGTQKTMQPHILICLS